MPKTFVRNVPGMFIENKKTAVVSQRNPAAKMSETPGPVIGVRKFICDCVRQ